MLGVDVHFMKKKLLLVPHITLRNYET